METKRKKSSLATTPGVVLSIITVIGATIVLFGIGEGLTFPDNPKTSSSLSHHAWTSRAAVDLWLNLYNFKSNSR